MAIIFDRVSYLDVIKNVSFGIDDNTITCILGSSNSGKSLLVDLISGVTSVYDENIIYADINYGNIGVMYQDIDDQFFFDNIEDEFLCLYSALVHQLKVQCRFLYFDSLG